MTHATQPTNQTTTLTREERELYRRVNLTILEREGYNIEIDTVSRESVYTRIAQVITGIDKLEYTGLILIRNNEIDNLIVKLLEYKTKLEV